MKLPISKKYVYAAALVVSIASILQAYTNAQHSSEQPFSWVDTSLFWSTNYFLWALLAGSIHRTNYFAQSLRDRKLWWIGANFIALVFFSLTHFFAASIAFSMLVSWIRGYEFIDFAFRTLSFVSTSIIGHVVDYVLIVAILWILDLYTKYHSEQSALKDAEKQLKSAQLSALRYQLNPHFLYNTLNTIASFMGKNGRGQEVVSALGNLLRAMLRDENEHLISLRQELDYVNDYLKIEKFRFEEKLEVLLNIDEAA